MELRDLLKAIRRFWGLALVVLAAFVVLGAAAAYLPAPRYRATATVVVQPSLQNVKDPSSFESIEIVRFLIPSIAQQVETRSFEDSVRKRLSGDAATAEFHLSGSFDPGTPLVRVSAQGPHPGVLAEAANSAATEMAAFPISLLVQITLVDPARKPTSPSGPLRAPVLFGATVLGVVAAVFSVATTSSFRRRVSGPEELRERFGLEVLVEIPAVRRFPGTAAELFTSPNSDPSLVDAYHRLRTNLEIALVGNRYTAIAVTSIAVGEGKSSVTANLAWALASLGQTVIAVDGDLRRPSLHRRLGGRPGPGVADIAAGVDVSSVVQRADLETLKLVAAGEPESQPTDRVRHAFPRLLEVLEGPGQLVLVDAPPMALAEANLIAGLTTAAILVIDADRRSPSEIRRAVTELGQVGATVVGAVINRSARSSFGGAHHYYLATSARSRRVARGR